MANGGDGHAPALAGAFDAPPHGACRRAGPTTTVTVEEQRAFRLAHDAHAWPRVQRAVAVEGGQQSERCDAVVRVAAKLRVDEEPRQSVGVHGRELKSLEGDSETAPQIIDPHQAHGFVLESAALVRARPSQGRSRRGP